MGHSSVMATSRRVAVVALATIWPGTIVAALAAGGAPLTVQVETGALRGEAALGVENFLDIPYAAPPVGDLRWRPTQPPAHWSGTRQATERGTYCPQPKTVDSAQVVTDEDCLHLNVQRPIGTQADAKLPVYVYIHGGGFVTGSGMKDTPEKIVRAAGVVGVSINYRLGALGFLALPGLEAGGTFGFLDQQAALEWVQHNIAAFGGAPRDVTIGGESAGGWSVCGHLVSARSRGLFSKAVIQSGEGGRLRAGPHHRRHHPRRGPFLPSIRGRLDAGPIQRLGQHDLRPERPGGPQGISRADRRHV